jgi:hypothetical protein
MRANVFNAQDSHLWEGIRPHAFSDVCINSASGSGTFCVGPYLLPDGVTAQRFSNSLVCVSPAKIEI